MSETNLRVAAKAVVVDNAGKVLILREADTYAESTNIGKWGLPGGRIEPDESFYDGLAREVREETGLKVKIAVPVHVDEWWPMIKGVKNHIVAMFIMCWPILRGGVVLSEEHDKFIWLDPADIDKYDLMPEDYAAIKAVPKLV